MLILYILTLYWNITPMYDTFGLVAGYIMQNIRKIKTFSIHELSSICHVSQSTISRFPRLLDYENLNAMTSSMRIARNDYGNNGQLLQADYKDSKEAYALTIEKMEEVMHGISSSIPYEQYLETVKLMKKAKHICISGSPVPQNAYSLQMELNLMNIQTSAYLKPHDQYETIDHLEDGDILIIYDGIAYESITEQLLHHKKDGVHLILISPYPQTNKIYKPAYYFPFTNMNFTMNLFSVSIITNYLLSVLQAEGYEG